MKKVTDWVIPFFSAEAQKSANDRTTVEHNCKNSWRGIGTMPLKEYPRNRLVVCGVWRCIPKAVRCNNL